MEIFKTGETNIVRNSLGIAESIFNEDCAKWTPEVLSNMSSILKLQL